MNPDSAADAVATDKQNAKLEHSRDGVTTRDDQADAGAPMLQGKPDERTGPEDALGRGPKRGDYRGRLQGSELAHEVVPSENGGETVTRFVDRESGASAKSGDKNAVEVAVDLAPAGTLEHQPPRADDIGDEAGKKGGVETDPGYPRA